MACANAAPYMEKCGHISQLPITVYDERVDAAEPRDAR
jgi:hypothetical protein